MYDLAYAADDDNDGFSHWAVPVHDTPTSIDARSKAAARSNAQSSLPAVKSDRVYGHVGGPPTTIQPQRPSPRLTKPAWNDHMNRDMPNYDATKDRHCVAYTQGRNFRKLEKQRKVLQEVEKVTRSKKPSAALWRRRKDDLPNGAMVLPPLHSKPPPPKEKVHTWNNDTNVTDADDDGAGGTDNEYLHPPNPAASKVSPRVIVDEHQRQLSDALSKERAARCALAEKKAKLEKQLGDWDRERKALMEEVTKWRAKVQQSEALVRKCQGAEQERNTLQSQLRKKEEALRDLKELYEQLQKQGGGGGGLHVAGSAGNLHRANSIAASSEEHRTKALRTRLAQESKCRQATEGLLTQANEESKKLREEVQKLRAAIMEQMKAAAAPSPRKAQPQPAPSIDSKLTAELDSWKSKCQRVEAQVTLLKHQVEDVTRQKDTLAQSLTQTQNTVASLQQQVITANKAAAAATTSAQTAMAPSPSPSSQIVMARPTRDGHTQTVKQTTATTTSSAAIQTNPAPAPPAPTPKQTAAIGINTKPPPTSTTKHAQCDPIPDNTDTITKLNKTVVELQAKITALEKFKSEAERSQKDRVIEELTMKNVEMEKQLKILSETNTALLQRLKQKEETS